MYPTIGRIVHFNHTTNGVTAAIITKVVEFEPPVMTEAAEVPEGEEILELAPIDPLEVELCLFMKSGISFVNARYKEEPTDNYWNWPTTV